MCVTLSVLSIVGMEVKQNVMVVVFLKLTLCSSKWYAVTVQCQISRDEVFSVILGISKAAFSDAIRASPIFMYFDVVVNKQR